MKGINFNINDCVRVHLNEEGFKILKEYFNGDKSIIETYNSGNNYYKFQLWELMNIFGKYLYNGAVKLPFDTNIIICLPEENKEQKKVKCKKSPDGEHDYIMSSDSFDSPYCRYCYKGS